MFVLVLLAARVAADWVEIAQHPHPASSRRVTLRYEGTTEANKIYANYTLTERPWHRTTRTRIPNFGIVKRVQLPRKDEDTLSVGVLPDSTHTEDEANKNRDYESMSPVRAPNMKIKENIKGGMNKLKSNMNIYRKINQTNTRIHSPFQYSDLRSEKTSMSPNVHDANTQEVVGNNKYQGIIVTGGGNKQTGTDNESREVNPIIKTIVHPIINPFDAGLPIEVQLDGEVHIKQSFNKSENNVKSNPGVQMKNLDARYHRNKTLPENKNFFPTHSYSSIPGVKNIIDYSLNKDAGANKQIKVENASKIHKSPLRIKDKSNDYSKPNLMKSGDVNLDDNTKTNTVQVIWKLMKLVTDNISKNTRRNFKSKIRYLEDLRNQIMANIAERVDQAWPDDAEAGAETETSGARHKRAARGHVEFPSSESALMTISFLTFAVFLIKLVLQVIHTYKNKTMMVTPTVVAAVGRAAAAAAASIREQART